MKSKCKDKDNFVNMRNLSRFLLNMPPKTASAAQFLRGTHYMIYHKKEREPA